MNSYPLISIKFNTRQTDIKIFYVGHFFPHFGNVVVATNSNIQPKETSL